MTPPTTTTALPETLVRIPLDRIVEHPHNVRSRLGDLAELTKSIEGTGIVSPLTVLPADEAGLHMLVAGHRRHAAAGRAKGVIDAPCVIRDLSEAQVIEMMLVENLQRAEITAVEEARGYARLVELGTKIAEIAKKVGRSQALVRSRLDLLVLPDPVLALVEQAVVTLGEAEQIAQGHADDDDALAWLAESGASDGRKFWHRGPVEALTAYVRRRNLDRDFDDAVAKATKAGHRIFEPPPSSMYAPTGLQLSRWCPLKYLELTVAKHRSEPCHAVRIQRDRQSGKVTTTHLCTQPKRHTLRAPVAQQSDVQMDPDLYGGPTVPDGTDEDAVTGTADPEAMTEAIWRAEILSQRASAAVAIRSITQIEPEVLRALLGGSAAGILNREGATEHFLELPAVPSPSGPSYSAAFTDHVTAADPPALARAFTAVVLAGLYNWVANSSPADATSPRAAMWLRWVMSHGHVPTEDAADLIAYAVDDLDRLDAAANLDPVPLKEQLSKLAPEDVAHLAELLFHDSEFNSTDGWLAPEETITRLVAERWIELHATGNDDDAAYRPTPAALAIADAIDELDRHDREA